MTKAARRWLVTALAASAVLALAIPAWAQQAGDGGSSAAQAADESIGAAAESVLILGDTVSGGASSKEAAAAVALGFGVDVVTNATWAAMTGPQFASYRAIVVGDPTCSSAGAWTAADANPGVWAPAVLGNVIVIGTDPVYHYSGTGANKLIEKSMAFVTATPGKTGFYADTSCESFDGPAPLLNAISPGWVGAGAGCDDAIHIVATNPYLLGLTDADLTGWGCSVHAYFTSWPSDFIPIGLNIDGPPLYTASDGAVGAPYILGRGEGLSSTNILLSPETATLDTGTVHTLSALVQFGGTPLADTMVTFTVLTGPNAGLVGAGLTDAAGIATFTYTSELPGVDEVQASFVNPNAITEQSNVVTVEWTGAVLVQPRFTG